MKPAPRAMYHRKGLKYIPFRGRRGRILMIRERKEENVKSEDSLVVVEKHN